MRTGFLLAAFGAAIGAGTAMLAAPGGQGQERPGQIGQARVWIENHRGQNEAVPIVLEEVATRSPIGVQVVGTPTVTIPSTAIVRVRPALQIWDYRTLNVPAAQDPAAMLSAVGNDGWDVAGILPAGPSASMVVLKRPR